ncbi:MAG: SPOR domain-containing protein [Solidesulfovibrio sp.]
MLKSLALALVVLTSLFVGCADETVYDWQRPHDTYQVGAFSKSQSAEDLKSKLQKNGYACRIETELKNGQFYLNVLVDVYDKTPETMARLEQISGVKPMPRTGHSGKASKSAVPAKDI